MNSSVYNVLVSFLLKIADDYSNELLNRKYQENIDDNQLPHQSFYLISLVQETRFEKKKSYPGDILGFDMFYLRNLITMH